MVDEFLRLPAVWDRANGELMHLDAFGADRAEHSIPEAAVRIMIFNGEDAPLRGPGAVQQRGAINGDDAIEIEDPHGDAGSFQCIVGLQGFEERDAGCDDRKHIRRALANDLRSADLERFIGSVQNRRLWTTGPNVDHPFVRSSHFDEPIRTGRIGRI